MQQKGVFAVEPILIYEKNYYGFILGERRFLL